MKERHDGEREEEKMMRQAAKTHGNMYVWKNNNAVSV